MIEYVAFQSTGEAQAAAAGIYSQCWVLPLLPVSVLPPRFPYLRSIQQLGVTAAKQPNGIKADETAKQCLIQLPMMRSPRAFFRRLRDRRTGCIIIYNVGLENRRGV